MPKSILRRLAATLAIASCFGGLTAAADAAVIKVGDDSPTNLGDCYGGDQVLWLSSDGVIASGGTVTAFSRHSTFTAANLALVVLRPQTGSTSVVVGSVAVSEPGDHALHSYPASISVLPGDQLALWSTGYIPGCNHFNVNMSAQGNATYSSRHGTPQPGDTMPTPTGGIPGWSLNLAASVSTKAKRCAAQTAAYFASIADREVAAEPYTDAIAAERLARAAYYANRSQVNADDLAAAHTETILRRVTFEAAKVAVNNAKLARDTCLNA